MANEFNFSKCQCLIIFTNLTNEVHALFYRRLGLNFKDKYWRFEDGSIERVNQKVSSQI
jgi:hypothetical protein